MNSNLDIIPSTDEYSEFINRLIKKSYSDDIRIPLNKDITIDDRNVYSTYIALLDKEPVGFFSIWINNFHPHSLYFIIIVEEKYRKKKIGTALYKHIVALNTNLPYLQSSFYEDSTAGSFFLESLGFKLYRTTQEPEIDISKIKINSETYKNYLKKNELEVLAFSDLSSDNDLLNVAEIVKQCYIDSHLDNPVKQINIKAWRNLMLDELIRDGSFVVKKDKRVIAFALMHECDDSSMDLGLRGVIGKYDFMRSKLIELLTNRQVEFAQKSDKRKLNTEIDDTDKWSTDMLSIFNLEKTKRWLSYQQIMKK